MKNKYLFCAFFALFHVLVAAPVCAEYSVAEYTNPYNPSPVISGEINENRSNLTSADEVIDPFSGALKLQYVDMRIAGHGDFDVEIARTYNTGRLLDDSPLVVKKQTLSYLGRGWDIHQGKIYSSVLAPSLCHDTKPLSVADNLVLELPNGSSQQFYRTLDPVFTNTTRQFYTSADNWLMACFSSDLTVGSQHTFAPPGVVVTAPNGDHYIFKHFSVDGATKIWHLTTKVSQNTANTQTFHYKSLDFPDQLSEITTSNGQTIQFTYDSTVSGIEKNRGRLKSVLHVNSGDTLTYDYDANKRLKAVHRNSIQLNRYAYAAEKYDIMGDVTNIITYQTSLITAIQNQFWQTTKYNYKPMSFYPINTVGAPSAWTVSDKFVQGFVPLDSPDLAYQQRYTDTMGGDRWRYTYEPCAENKLDRTTVLDPLNQKTTYHHHGVRCLVGGNVWKTGLLVQKKTYAGGDGSGVIYQEDYTWSPRKVGNEVNIDFGAVDELSYAPMLAQKIITAQGRSYTTDYSNFNQDGLPQLIVESGQSTRNTVVEYLRKTTLNQEGTPDTTNQTKWNWLIGLKTKETISVNNKSLGAIDYLYTGNKLGQIKKFGVMSTYLYDANGNIRTYQDPAGGVTTYANYIMGHPQLVTFEDKTTIQQTVNPRGFVTQQKDQKQQTHSYAYDGLGRLTQYTPPIGAAVSLAYKQYGNNNIAGVGLRITQTQGPLVTETILNGNGQRISSSVSGTQNGVQVSQSQTTTYDALGQTKRSYSPNSVTDYTEYAYDTLGRMTKQTLPDGTYQQYTYDDYNNTVTYRNPAAHIWRYQYRSFGDPATQELMGITAPDNSANVSIIRNGLGQPLSITQNGVTRTYEYDERFLLRKETHPEVGTTTYHYMQDDLLSGVNNKSFITGPIVKKKLGSNAATYFNYDAMDRPLEQLTPYLIPTFEGQLTFWDIFSHYPKKPQTGCPPDQLSCSLNYWFTTQYQYDNKGQVTYSSNKGIAKEYRYDALDRIDQESIGFGEKPSSSDCKSCVIETPYTILKTAQYKYNSLGHLNSIVYPSGNEVFLYPDVLGRPTKMTSTQGNIANSIAYHVSGSVSTLAYSNGQTLNATYNSKRFWPSTLSMSKIGTTQIPVASITYSNYDSLGNVQSIMDSISPERNRTITYDNLERIKTVAGPWGNSSFNYNGNGDILSRQQGSKTYTYAYNANKTLNTVKDEKSTQIRQYAYDGYGNISQDGRFTYTYDPAQNLHYAGGSTHLYDANNRKIKTIAGGKETVYFYNHQGLLLGEYSQSGAAKESIEYIYLQGKLIGSITSRPQYTQCSAPALTYYLTDNTGSTLAATSATGAILWKEHYSPLGERQVKSSTSGKNSQYFHGKEQDTTTGLQYFGARWYDPMVGRFMAVDPAAVDAEDEGDSGLVHEFNRYAFVANNPHKYVDPDGAMTVNNGSSGNAPRYAVTGAQSNPTLGYTFGGMGGGASAYRHMSNIAPMPGGGGYTTAAQMGGAGWTAGVNAGIMANLKNLVAKPVHGNSLATTKPTILYGLYDKITGALMKFGETIRGKKRYTQKFYKENNLEMVPLATGTKKEMRALETQKIKEYKAANGGARPPMNKSDH